MSTGEDQEQAVGESGVGNLVQPDAGAVPEVEPLYERWPKDDLRLLMRAATMTGRREVKIALLCSRCDTMLQVAGQKGDGSTVMRCRCAARVWDR